MGVSSRSLDWVEYHTFSIWTSAAEAALSCVVLRHDLKSCPDEGSLAQDDDNFLAGSRSIDQRT